MQVTVTNEYPSVADEMRDILDVLLPPERVPVSESADRNVQVVTPGGYNGPWITPPYLKRPLDCVSGKEYQGICFITSAQAMKSMAFGECVVDWNARYNYADMMHMHPRQDDARQYCAGRLTRLHRHSPGLPDLVQKIAAEQITYKKGHSLYLAWPVVSKLSGKTLQIITFSDYDRYVNPDDIDGEGDAWGLGFNRIKTLLSRGKVIVESSPKGEVINAKKKPESDHSFHESRYICGIYQSGTRERWYWPCPHCEDFFMVPSSFSEQHLWLPEGETDLMAASEQAALICPHCASLVDFHSLKLELNSRGAWVGDGQTIDRNGDLHGDKINTNTASFALSGYAAALQKPKDLVLRYLQARADFDRTGSEEQLKQVTNTQLGAPYIPKRALEGQKASDLERREKHGEKGVIPDWVRVLLASVDVQKGRFVVEIHGFGNNEEAVVDRFNRVYSQRWDDAIGDNHKIAPDVYLEDWDVLLDSVISRKYKYEDGRELGVYVTACDTGGQDGVTNNAYDFWRKVHADGLGHKLALVKGVGRENAPRVKMTRPDATNVKGSNSNAAGDVPVYMINTNLLKDAISNNLQRTERGIGYVQFCKGLTSGYYNELVAETRTPKGWVNEGNNRNESFDLFVYIRAMYIELGFEATDWKNPPDYLMPETESAEEADSLAKLGELLNGPD